MKKSFRILLTLVIAVVMVLSLTACINNCSTGMHDFVEVSAKEATCTQAGNIAYKKCKVCNLYVDATGKKISANSVDIPAGHSYVKHSAEPASCTEAGNAEYYTCDKCNAIFDADKVAIEKLPEIPATHTFGEWVAEVSATCSATGTKGHKDCSVCNKHFDADGKELESIEIAVNPTAHTFGEWVAEIPATCTTAGTKGHKDCSVCNKHFDADGVEITDLAIPVDTTNGHDWTDVAAKSATCTAAGYSAHQECSICHETTGKTDYPAGHTWDSDYTVDTPATCTTTGSESIHCSKCDATKDSRDIPAAHKFGTWIAEIPATCTTAGTKGHKDCSVCEKHFDNDGKELETIEIAVNPTAHKFSELSKEIPATCTSEGTLAHKDCEYCKKHFDNAGKELTNLVIEKAAHTEVTDKAVAATCTSTGLTESKHCSVCETVIVEQTITPKLAHTLTETAAKAETCTEAGNVQYWTCSVCKGTFSNAEGTTTIAADNIAIGAKGHQQATTLSCDANGHYYACQNGCGARLNEKAHNPETIAAKPASCTAAGSTEGSKCKDCDYVITAPTPINATGHNYGTLVAKDPATCVATGVDAHYQCSSCKGYFTSEKIATNWTDLVLAIDSSKHNLTSTTAPDATYHYGATCSDCGYTAVKEEHSFGDYIHDQSEAGVHYHYQKCSCGYIRNNANCTAGDPVDENVQNATCTEAGKKDVVTYCSTCSTELSRQKDVTIDKIAHNYEEHVATSASCTEDGNEKYYTCKNCTLIFDADKDVISAVPTIPAAHDFGEWVAEVPATCSATGTKGHKDCSVCNKHFDTNGVEITDLTISKIAHTYAEVEDSKYLVSAATCKDYAVYYKSCTCGAQSTETFNGNTYAAHTFGEVSYVWAEDNSTCTATRTCSRDANHVETETATASANVTQNATCTLPKLSTLTATFANSAFAEQTKADVQTQAALGHDEQSHVAQAPTCTEVGWDAYVTCSRCSYTTYSEKQATGHDMEHHDADPATCTAEGNIEYWSCSECEKDFSDEAGATEIDSTVDPAKGHSYSYDDTSSTQHTKKCENCDIAQVQEAHSYDDTTHKCICNKAEPEWKLVTDASTLVEGDKIIIVGVKDNTKTYYALSTNQKTNNRGQASVTKNNDGTVTITDSVQVLTLANGTKDGTWAFYTGSGYLYAASSSSNHLKTQDDKTDNSSWTITITDEGVATIKAQGENTVNWLRYNSNSDLFSCYSPTNNNMQDVSIYKLDESCTHPAKFTTTTTADATCTEPGKNVTTCSYCGTTTTTVIAGQPALDHDLTYTTTDTHHTATCSRTGCNYTEESTQHDYSTGADGHTCVCGATEPTYTITVTNYATGESSATVVVKVGDDVISAGEDGKYTIYQGREVTITATAPTGYTLFYVKKDGVEITTFVDSHTFTINSNTTFEIAIQVIDASHNHSYTVAVPLATTHAQYDTHHQMKCDSCTDISDDLQVHNWTTVVKVDDDSVQHKVVCVCGHEKLVDHDFEYSAITDSQHTATCKSTNCGYTETVDHIYGTDNKCVCGKDKPAITTAIAQYTTKETQNMKKDVNNASLIGLDEDIFVVNSATPNGGTNQVGLNRSGEIRIYGKNNCSLTISVKEGYQIESITITLASDSNTLAVTDSENSIALNNGIYTINNNSVVITNTSKTQVKIKSITIVYKQVSTTQASE